MTMLVKINGLCKEWDGRVIFEKVDLELMQGERIALFGRNGVGKSTLLYMMTNRAAADGGTIERKLPISEWGWMDQQTDVGPDLFTIDYVQSDGGEQWKAEKRLRQMKLDPGTWYLPYAQLSGGQKTRAQLARLMVNEPKLLLLDEPTNHLDEESLRWLESWVRSYPGTVLFVSHDRAFIDAVADGICEITASGSRKYKGGYTDYLAQKELERRTQEALYRKQEQARKELEECIRNYQQWFVQAEKAATKVEVGITKSYYKAKANKNISRYHAKERELERLEAESVEKPRDTPQLKMQLQDSEFAARTLMRLESVAFSYEGDSGYDNEYSGDDKRLLFDQLHVAVERGDRLAVIGPNGTGKSTLLRLMLGELTPTAGQIKVHPQTQIGYFSQELEGLNGHETLLDSLLSLPNMTQTYARTILGCFLFSRDDVFKRIEDLSMGEKCRVAFLKLYFSGANLLVLDEPTNYFDIDTRERVEHALMEYSGALVVVSHDRYLVRKLGNKLLMLDGTSQCKQFQGNLSEWEELERDRYAASSDPALVDEARLLEMQIVQWMNASADSAEEQAANLERIHKARKWLAEIQAKMSVK